MKNNKLHLTCECHTHELHIESDHELNMWYISFWQRGYGAESSFIYKLKCMWHILKHGRPYGDEVILNKADLVKLKKYIDKELEP